MKDEAYSTVQVKESARKQVLALCPEGTDPQEFFTAFVEKALSNAVSLFDMLPGAAASCIAGSRPWLPVLPTREEVAAYCNAWWPDRPHPITVETVRRWQRQKFLKPHPSDKEKTRYVNTEVVDFLNGKFGSPFRG